MTAASVLPMRTCCSLRLSLSILESQPSSQKGTVPLEGLKGLLLQPGLYSQRAPKGKRFLWRMCGQHWRDHLLTPGRTNVFLLIH